MSLRETMHGPWPSLAYSHIHLELGCVSKEQMKTWGLVQIIPSQLLVRTMSTGNLASDLSRSLIGTYDLSANPIGLEQSWPRKPLTGSSKRSAVCHESILLAGLGKQVHLGTSPPSWLPLSMGNIARATFNIYTYIDRKPIPIQCVYGKEQAREFTPLYRLALTGFTQVVVVMFFPHFSGSVKIKSAAAGCISYGSFSIDRVYFINQYSGVFPASTLQQQNAYIIRQCQRGQI